MRLTLRNLLRFLDQTNLRSIERNRLEELVEQSEKADAWIKRIDTLKRSSKVATPPIDCPDQPVNRVAAYLDSTIGEEATIEFEKTMLSSDELLAEVASCHEIRESLRNEDSVAIPILLRQSVYDLGRDLTNYEAATTEQADGDESAEESSVAALAASMEDLPYVDSKPNDPHPIGGFSQEGDEPDDETVSIDSLSRKAQRRSQIVMAILIAILLGMLALSYELGRQAGKYSKELPGDPRMAGLGSVDDEDKDAEAPGQLDVNDDKKSSGESVDGDSKESSADDKANKTSSADETDYAGMFPLVPELVPELPVNDREADMQALPNRPNISSMAVAEATEPERPALPIATIPNANTVLLQRDPEQQQWIRASTTAPINEGTELVLLAGTSADLDFGGNLIATVSGPARFTIGRRDIASGADVIDVQHGRFAVKSNVADMDLLFDRKDRRYRMTMPVSESMASAQFSHFLPPGDDPKDITPAQIELFYANKGRLSLTQDDATWLLPESTAMVRSVSDEATLNREPATGSVSWPLPQRRDYTIRLKETVDKNFQDVPQELQGEASVLDFLVDLKGNVRQERRFAAVAWLASIGNYSYLVDFLNDEKNRNNWRSAIESVRASILRHPEHATALYESLLAGDSARRDIMYKLILGYTQQELESGADKTLVGYLDHDSLCVRVLAIETIRHITGGLAYGYTPNADRKSRRRTIKNQWEKALKKGDLRYSETPRLPIPEFIVAPDPSDEDSSEQAPADASGN